MAYSPVYRIERNFVAAQLDSVFSDVRIDTTKIGMLAETDIVEAVAEQFATLSDQNVVLDTVMLAKAATRCFHLRQLPRYAVDYCHRFH